jgi:hypothetical protein
MVKRERKVKSEGKEFGQEKTDFEEFPESILETLALIGSAAKIMMLNEIEPGAFSGRNGDFIFNLVYDPANKIDPEMFRSAIVDIMKKIDPSAINIEVPNPFADFHEKEDNV